MSPYMIHPYSFGYTVKDKFGDQHRQETGDGQKFIKGSYGYQDSQRLHRQVDYIADKDGFRAEVKTNEPGTASQNPAAVQMISSAHPYFGIGYEFGDGAGGSKKDAGKTSVGKFAGIKQGFDDGLGYEDGTKGQELGTYLGHKGMKGLGYSNGFGYGAEGIMDKGFGNGFGYGIGGIKGQSFDAGFGYGNGGMKGHAFNNDFGYGTGLKGLGYGDGIEYGNRMKSLHGRSGYGGGVKGLGLGNVFRYGGTKGGKGVSDIALSFKRTGYDDIGHDGYTLEI
ncbi:glycine-rich cell wall structural protein 1.8-like [Stegodyphus dumicola]|uniref:glycine-rich cell wall structural protein 1.8-like n=1 Tax=Stegodyphus dumicola TaxID=202533 RepID=UPI0015B2AC3B|nr:glycine-rich cell wall structural protein 1.8-like [Stegodyphus dumicola]